MRKLFIAVVIILLAAPSCKKSSGSNGIPVGINFKLDGASMTLNSARAVKTSSGSIYSLQFYGYVGAGGASNELACQIQAQSGPITATTYTEGVGVDMVSIAYFIYSPYDAYQNNGSATNPVSITITSITSTNVQGTFKGDISNGFSTKVLANGTFNIDF